MDKPKDDGLLRFSFKHLDVTNPKFNPSKCADGYISKFVERLRDLSSMKTTEFRSNRSSSLKAHPIDFKSTSEKDGFACLANAQLEQCQPWQFEITRNAHGRVHGLLIMDTFYVVWIDPNHELYP